MKEQMKSLGRQVTCPCTISGEYTVIFCSSPKESQGSGSLMIFNRLSQIFIPSGKAHISQNSFSSQLTTIYPFMQCCRTPTCSWLLSIQSMVRACLGKGYFSRLVHRRAAARLLSATMLSRIREAHSFWALVIGISLIYYTAFDLSNQAKTQSLSMYYGGLCGIIIQSCFRSALRIQVIILMSVSEVFHRKLKLEMKLLHIVQKKPKSIIKLDPIDEQDFIISHESVQQWSRDNEQLYHLILQNGMAEFICNKEYLFQFYKHLSFQQQNITHIDDTMLHFKNIKVLQLMQNSIKAIENIPKNCKELYLDFNCISEVKLREGHSLELLSICGNQINDASFTGLTRVFPELRCLNVAWNKICKLKEFVGNLGNCSKLKVLVAHSNPISMLNIYYSYLTDHIQLAYIDGVKYVKVEQVKKEEPKVQQKKQVKQQKKDAKKDTKKGGKVEQKPVEEPPKVEVPKVIPKRQLTNEDFQKVKLHIKIGNIQKFVGNSFEASLFPADTQPSKMQTSFWLKYFILGEQTQQKSKSLTFDAATTQNEEIRLNLDITIQKQITLNYDSFLLFNSGLRLEVWQAQPKMVKDAQTFELKPELKDGSVVINTSILGSTVVDLRRLHPLSKKELKSKLYLFKQQATTSPLFYDPYENEQQLVSSKKLKFQQKLKKQEQERVRKLQEQQQLKLQKKGGKDQKKPPEKKPPAKKDGKQPPAAQKKKSQRCQYPIDARLYCVIEQEQMFKGKQLLCVSIQVQ